MNIERQMGLDFARFLALSGMVVVHFRLLMLAPAIDISTTATLLYEFFEGKAAATFVVLAGIGFGLAYERKDRRSFTIDTLKKAGILFIFGIANMVLFEADIIHYYAVYFMLALVIVPLKRRYLTLLMLGFSCSFLMTNQAIVPYDTSWDWDKLVYQDLWSINGFLRNLFFNGWHPIFPWFGFFIFGLMLAKSDFSKPFNKYAMVIVGGIGLTTIPTVAGVLQPWLIQQFGTDTAANFLPSPIPPGPVYMLTGICTASFVIGSCLLIPASTFQNKFLETIAFAGQQSLTLYFAHILVGMGIIEELGLVNNTGPILPLVAVAVFLEASLIYVYFWRKKFKKGPAEALLRRLTR